MKLIRMVLVGFMIFGFMAGCGGGGSSSDDAVAATTETPIQLSGTVAAPTVASASISKGLGKASLSDSAAACDSVKVYQLTTGTEVASGTCASDGSFRLDALKSLMTGNASDESGATFTFRGIFVATVGGSEIMGYVEAEIGSDTTSIAADAIDSDSLIVVMDMLSQLGVTNITDLRTALAGINATTLQSFNPRCFFRMQREIIENADPTQSGLHDDAAKARDACRARMASGGAIPSGYANWGMFMRDCVHGDLPAEVQSDVASSIDGMGLDYLSGSDWRENYSSYTGVMDKFADAVGDTLAGDAGLVDLSVSPLVKVAGSSGSFCESDIEDSETVSNFASAFLGAADATEFDRNFVGEGMRVWIGAMEQFKDGGSWDKFDPAGMHSMFAQYEGNFDGFFAGGVLDPEAIGTVHNFFRETDFSSFDSENDRRAYFEQLGDTMREQVGSGGWDTFYGREDVFATEWQYEYHEGGGAISFEAMDSGVFDGRKICVDNCMAHGGTPITCYPQCFDDGEEEEGGAPQGGGEPQLSCSQLFNSNLCTNRLEEPVPGVDNYTYNALLVALMNDGVEEEKVECICDFAKENENEVMTRCISYTLYAAKAEQCGISEDAGGEVVWGDIAGVYQSADGFEGLWDDANGCNDDPDMLAALGMLDQGLKIYEIDDTHLSFVRDDPEEALIFTDITDLGPDGGYKTQLSIGYDNIVNLVFNGQPAVVEMAEGTDGDRPRYYVSSPESVTVYQINGWITQGGGCEVTIADFDGNTYEAQIQCNLGDLTGPTCTKSFYKDL